jgi:hypothetical protein
LSSKSDTLGGKYPVFYHNTQVAYKTFPISGLLSRLAEYKEDESVRTSTLSMDEIDSIPDFNTNLSNGNIYYERIYKLDLLDWLNNN